MREFSECYYIQTRQIRNDKLHLEGMLTWPKVLEAMEPERRFKRWNKANIQRINERLKELDCTVDRVFLCNGRYSFKGHEICLSYKEKLMPENQSTEPICRSQWHYIDLNNLEGEHIIEEVKKPIDRFVHNASQSRNATIEELEEFYKDFEALKAKHSCFERAIRLLTDRNIR